MSFGRGKTSFPASSARSGVLNTSEPLAERSCALPLGGRRRPLRTSPVAAPAARQGLCVPSPRSQPRFSDCRHHTSLTPTTASFKRRFREGKEQHRSLRGSRPGCPLAPHTHAENDRTQTTPTCKPGRAEAGALTLTELLWRPLPVHEREGGAAFPHAVIEVSGRHGAEAGVDDPEHRPRLSHLRGTATVRPHLSQAAPGCKSTRSPAHIPSWAGSGGCRVSEHTRKFVLAVGNSAVGEGKPSRDSHRAEGKGQRDGISEPEHRCQPGLLLLLTASPNLTSVPGAPAPRSPGCGPSPWPPWHCGRRARPAAGRPARTAWLCARTSPCCRSPRPFRRR